MKPSHLTSASLKRSVYIQSARHSYPNKPMSKYLYNLLSGAIPIIGRRSYATMSNNFIKRTTLFKVARDEDIDKVLKQYEILRKNAIKVRMGYLVTVRLDARHRSCSGHRLTSLKRTVNHTLSRTSQGESWTPIHLWAKALRYLRNRSLRMRKIIDFTMSNVQHIRSWR